MVNQGLCLIYQSLAGLRGNVLTGLWPQEWYWDCGCFKGEASADYWQSSPDSHMSNAVISNGLSISGNHSSRFRNRMSQLAGSVGTQMTSCWTSAWLWHLPQWSPGFCFWVLFAVMSCDLFFSSEHVCSFSQSLWWRELVVICLNQAFGFQDTCCCLIYRSLSMSGNKLCKPCPLVYLPQKRVLGINIVLCHGH